MLDCLDTSTDYLLRVAAEEIDYMEKENLLGHLPHVAAAVHHPVGKFLLRHLQNFCWTAERLWRRVHPGVLAEGTVCRQHLHPRLATTSRAGSLRPKIWIDVTNTYRTGFGGGIGRVAMQLAKTGGETGLAMPVVIENGCVYEYFERRGGREALCFDADVVYVVVDSFWQQMAEYRFVCETAKVCGAKVVACIHDVIPLYFPSFNRTEFVDTFTSSFEEMIELSDACITVSQYTCRKVQYSIEDFRLRRGRPLPITYFHLGADGHVAVEDRDVRAELLDIFTQPPVFLSVGTLEPRKGYAVTLDAFDSLWQRDIRCRFLIIGRPGWISKSLQRRIIEHPLYGHLLHWIPDATDAELTFAYREAHCVIQASITEGFGLPIVEANLEGTPVIATDNEIFRELGGDEMIYFRRCDSADLTAKIENAVAHRPRVGRLDLLRWDQSLEQMVSRITRILAQPVA